MTNTVQSEKLRSAKTTRREFLGTATAGAAAASGASFAPRLARAQNANDMLGVGFIGVGGRGQYHVRMLQGMIESGEKIRLVAVSDTYGPRMRSAAERSKSKTYLHYQELLADKEVDAVCIASPDRLHIPQALDAIRAGKDVYCEKPMGHWSQFELSKQLLEETRKLNRVVQVGNQGNSSSFWPRIRELIQKGAIGRPQHVQAGFYRYGDWGERMFSGRCTQGPFQCGEILQLAYVSGLCGRAMHGPLSARLHADIEHPGPENAFPGQHVRGHFQIR
jgi:hypothetical protein